MKKYLTNNYYFIKIQMNNIIAQLLQQNRIVQQNSEGLKLLENLWVEQRRQISDITDVSVL